MTPAGPRGSHHERSLCVGFRIANTVSTCSHDVTRLNRLRECGLPCGPQDSLCTLRMHCSAIHRGRAELASMFGARCIDLFDILLCIRNTRYGRLVRPYPAGTLTPPEMPSFPGALTSVINSVRLRQVHYQEDRIVHMRHQRGSAKQLAENREFFAGGSEH